MAAFRSILCPTDLSPVGDHAAEVAYALVAPGGVVHLLHVLEAAIVVSPVDGTPLMPLRADPAAENAVERRARDHMQALSSRRGAEKKDVRTEVHVVEDTGVSGRIVAEARRCKADTIVLGTHGRTGFGRLVLGSVAAEVLRTKATRVVLVHVPEAKKT